MDIHPEQLKKIITSTKFIKQSRKLKFPLKKGMNYANNCYSNNIVLNLFVKGRKINILNARN